MASLNIAQSARRFGVVKTVGITEQTYYRWRKEYGGPKVERARRFKELGRENTHLRRAVTDLTLDKLILKGGAGPWPKPA